MNTQSVINVEYIWLNTSEIVPSPSLSTGRQTGEERVKE
jgi:hypothetical protein